MQEFLFLGGTLDYTQEDRTIIYFHFDLNTTFGNLHHQH